MQYLSIFGNLTEVKICKRARAPRLNLFPRLRPPMQAGLNLPRRLDQGLMHAPAECIPDPEVFRYFRSPYDLGRLPYEC